MLHPSDNGGSWWLVATNMTEEAVEKKFLGGEFPRHMEEAVGAIFTLSRGWLLVQVKCHTSDESLLRTVLHENGMNVVQTTGITDVVLRRVLQ